MQNGETIASVTLNCSGGPATSPVSGSPYAITPSAATPGTFTASNYSITYNNGSLTVNPKPLTITAIGNNKNYDGTTTAYLTTTGDNRVPGDLLTITATANFSTRNVGTHITVTITLWSLSGPAAGNYVVNYGTSTTTVYADISQYNITIMAATDSRVYNGTTSSVGVPAPSVGTYQTGDSAPVGGWTQTFDSRNVGARTLIVTPAAIQDGNGGANYNVTYATNTGSISQYNITIKSATDSRVYNGTTSSVGIPAPSVGTYQPGDSAPVGGWTQTFDSRNVGARTLIVTPAAIQDGNGGFNYNVTYLTNTGSISQYNITIKAATDSRVYNGTTSSTGIPTVFVGAHQPGDSAPVGGWTQTFDSRNVGARTLIVTPANIQDGNGGLNYNVTYLTNTGSISQYNITIKAATDSRVYNGTTSSTGIPTVFVGAYQPGDSAPVGRWTKPLIRGTWEPGR